MLSVPGNGYYSYQKRLSARPLDPTWDEKVELVKEISESSGSTYGYRRIGAALAACGHPVSKGEAKKLMKAAEVKVKQKKRYKVTTDSNHSKPVFDNILEQNFFVEQPEQVYVQDITYIRTAEGWLYLAVVIDLFHREVVGWSMGSRMTAKLVTDALEMAIWRRRPKPGLIVHSDRGSQYASHAYRTLLEKHEFIGSMSRPGNCWDNAVVESFFGSLKQELVHWKAYQSRLEAQQDILNYIVMHYNGKRLHSSLGYMSPRAYEEHWKTEKKAA